MKSIILALILTAIMGIVSCSSTSKPEPKQVDATLLKDYQLDIQPDGSIYLYDNYRFVGRLRPNSKAAITRLIDKDNL